MSFSFISSQNTSVPQKAEYIIPVNTLKSFDSTAWAQDINKTLGGNKKNMETLYSVIVVTKTREVIIDDKVVAKDPETAKFKVAYEYLFAKGLTPDDVNIIVTSLSQVKVEKDKQH